MEVVTLLLSGLTIFALRILDVSLGTLRIGFLVRGQRLYAGAFGFVESLVWLVAVSQVITNLDSVYKMIGYAGGYAVGTMLGVSIEKWLAMGDAMVRVVTPANAPSPSAALRAAGFPVTEVNARGRDGDVSLSFAVVPRKKLVKMMKLLEEISPEAFITVEQTSLPRQAARKAISGSTITHE